MPRISLGRPLFSKFGPQMPFRHLRTKSKIKVDVFDQILEEDIHLDLDFKASLIEDTHSPRNFLRVLLVHIES